MSIQDSTRINETAKKDFDRASNALGVSSSGAFTVSTNKTPKMSRTEMLGCIRGQFPMSDDFDAPLDASRSKHGLLAEI